MFIWWFRGIKRISAVFETSGSNVLIFWFYMCEKAIQKRSQNHSTPRGRGKVKKKKLNKIMKWNWIDRKPAKFQSMILQSTKDLSKTKEKRRRKSKIISLAADEAAKGPQKHKEQNERSNTQTRKTDSRKIAPAPQNTYNIHSKNNNQEQHWPMCTHSFGDRYQISDAEKWEYEILSHWKQRKNSMDLWILYY